MSDATSTIPASPATGPQSTSLDDIATTLAGSMPDVQEHAVAQAHKEQQVAESAPRDKNGELFDPSRHIVDSSGKPMLTVRGTWTQKRGRKANSAGPAQSGTNSQPQAKSMLGGPAAPPVAPDPLAVQHAQSRAAGVAAAELLFMTGKLIGGEEWEPMQNKALGLDERTLMHGAFGDYFVASGVKDIPPGAALTFCIVAYIAPRFAMPKTQSRFAKIKSGIVTWWVNRKLRKQGLDLQVQAKEAK